MNPKSPDLNPEAPPEIPKRGFVDWEAVVEIIKQKPGEWMRLHHDYANVSTARSSASRAARTYGFDYRVSTLSPQEDGKPGIFVKYGRKG